jgi:hypothetical protein
VRSVDAGFSDVVRWHLSPFQSALRPLIAAFYTELYVDEDDAGLDPAPYSLFIAGSRRVRHPSLAAVLAHAVSEVQALVPRLARDFLCVHAGAVAREGDCVLIPAPMEHGKSSLVIALLQRGFAYLSDEAGPIDPITGQVHPFPRHIKLDRAAASFFPALDEHLQDRMFRIDTIDRFVRPEDVGASVGRVSPVRWLVFPTATWDGPPRLTRMSRAEAVHRMVGSCFNLHRYQERGAIVLARVAGGAEAFLLEGGSPVERAALLEDRLV